ncbi:putative polisoprenol-linked O-antigen transporter [Vibrio cholerae]|nr:putative O-antigen flippase [Vibrio cholerae]GHZ93852.1 putative polisoprenol-linked O-antigen transporter [Vibrio cholerae]
MNPSILRIIVPFLIFPILSSRLNENNFGIYIYIVSLSAWFSIAIEYSFRTTGIKIINQEKEVNDVVWGVFFAKIIMSILIIPFVFFLYKINATHSQYYGWYIVGWGVALLNGLSPYFYYLNYKRLDYLAKVELISWSFFILLIILYIESDEDVILLQLLLLLTRVFCLFFQSKNIYFRPVDIKMTIYKSLQYLKYGRGIFFFQFVISLYTSFNIVIVGHFCSLKEVALYGCAERFIRVGVGFLSQTGSVAYSKLERIKYKKIEIKKTRELTFIFLMLVSVFGVFFTYYLSPFMIDVIFGYEYKDAITFIRVMALAFPAIAVSNTLGYQVFVFYDQIKDLNTIMLIAALISMISGVILVSKFGALAMACVWVSVEWLISLSMVIYYYFKKEDFNEEI